MATTTSVDGRASGFDSEETAIVTGGGNGIGRATCLELARLGVRVAVWDIDERTAKVIADEVQATGGVGAAFHVDIAKASDVERALHGTIELGRPAYLVNNAAPADQSINSFESGVVTAAGSTHMVTEAWLSACSHAAKAVVTVASIAAFYSTGTDALYSAGKAAVVAYTRALAVQRPGNIRANIVAPGIINTRRTEGLADTEGGRQLLARCPLKRFGWPEEVASVITFLLSPASSYVNGTVLVIDGGLTVSI